MRPLSLLVMFVFAIFAAGLIRADTVRVATFNVSMGRAGPGVLLKNILSGKDEQILAVAEIIKRTKPDILLLNEFDSDYTHIALTSFLDLLATGEDGIRYPYFHAPMGNEGVASGFDLDGDGKPYEWADAYGFGRFPGNQGMALISRFPIDADAARSFSHLRWTDHPDMRLSSKSHWDVPVKLPNGSRIHVLASHPTPPVFDGDDNLNGRRNDAEIAFWVAYLNGQEFSDDQGRVGAMDAGNFVILGDLNNDVQDGEGLKSGLTALLTHPLVFDPRQISAGGPLAAQRIGGANKMHLGDPAMDTVEWDADIGNMRVDYALPSKNMKVMDSGVFWPLPDSADGPLIAEGREGASNHRLVWVDVQPAAP